MKRIRLTKRAKDLFGNILALAMISTMPIVLFFAHNAGLGIAPPWQRAVSGAAIVIYALYAWRANAEKKKISACAKAQSGKIQKKKFNTYNVA